ncbi:MAG: TetR family transcriptional regulator [Actinomycetota bacterium]|nr:TetR family transcriptional regulator [Actinomycetota bacterium]
MSGGRTTRGAQRREEIVAAARTVLVCEGIDAFVLRHLAQRLDMRVGNLQYYFPTRDDLLEAVVRAELERDLDAVRAQDQPDAERRLAAAIEVLAERWIVDECSVYQPIGLLAAHDERFAALTHEVNEAFHAELAAIVAGVSPGVDADEARVRALLISALVDGATMQRYPDDGPLARGPMLERLAALAVTIARTGGGPPPVDEPG